MQLKISNTVNLLIIQCFCNLYVIKCCYVAARVQTQCPSRVRPRRWGSPDPIPNSVVKPTIAEGTTMQCCGRIGRRTRKGLFFYSTGSNPSLFHFFWLKSLVIGNFPKKIPIYENFWFKMQFVFKNVVDFPYIWLKLQFVAKI